MRQDRGVAVGIVLLIGLLLSQTAFNGRVTLTGPNAINGTVPSATPIATLRTAYLAQGCGALIHWNMSTFVNAQWANPDLDPNTFAPSGLDIDQWLDALVSAGCHYAILTAKHHDGFALWPTAYHVTGFQPYSIAQTTWYTNNGNPDVVSLFVTKCRNKGLNPGLYFSIWDRTYEVRSGTTAATDPAGYNAMVRTQIQELLTNYGSLITLWTDGWGWSPAPTTPGASGGGVDRYGIIGYPQLYTFGKVQQLNFLWLENNHIHPATGYDYEIYEMPSENVSAGNTRPSEVVETILSNEHWFWQTGDNATATKTAAYLAAAIIFCNANSSTYSFGLSPNTAGVLPANEVTTLGQVRALIP